MTAGITDDTIPDTAASTVEFVSATNYDGGSELRPASLNIDLGAYRNWVCTLESAGFDYTLNGYSAASADGSTAPQRFARALGNTPPQNKGAQRALGFAAASDSYDRALWTPTASATNAAGASTALVGSCETVAAAILDYIDAGANIVSICGYGGIRDIEKYGEFILPLVRAELEHRRATGKRGRLQREHLGYGDPDFLAAHDAAAAKAGLAA